ncbi:MAG: YcnI family protein [Mycobacterium sp.]
MPKLAMTLRLSAMFVALGGCLLATAGSASAHVRVDGTQPPPPKGGSGIVELIVPSESASASTVGLTITFPKGVDLTSARTLPVAGWTSTVETEPAGDGERVSRISWRATEGASGLKPSEFGEFTFSAGPWPKDVDSSSLPTDQSYSDGSVVSWNEVAVDADSEPEHPAPVVALGPAVTGDGDGDVHGDTHRSAVGAAPAPGEDHSAHAAAQDPGHESWVWPVTSLVSLVVALGTAVALVVVLRRSRAAS